LRYGSTNLVLPYLLHYESEEHMAKLDGRVAVITGTSPNIMGGIAEGMAAEGAYIVAVDLNPEYAHGCAEAIRKQGSKAIGIPCDVTNEERVKSVFQAARQEFGGVDIMVNGAVLQNQKGLLEMPSDEWRRQIDIILTGYFLFSKYAAQMMIDLGRHGNIINIVSTEGHQGNVGSIGYGTAKAGLLNFTRQCAMELAEYGIRVNSLTPTATDPREGMARADRWGVTWGPPRSAFASGLSGLIEERRKMTPMLKLPSPSDYAKAAVFLASDDASMITGLDLRVDAGNIAKYWGWNPSDPSTRFPRRSS
jgi:NAD(P)-dependent dehydrogenase (short-subunit alcohol dehydrogenase family)